MQYSKYGCGRMENRGQTFTLEAFVAAVLLIATLAFALQAVTVTSNTASAGDTETRNQHVGIAEGVLDEAVATGSLRTTLTYWNETSGRFHNADEEDGYYISRLPPTPNGTAFGDSLERSFGDRQVRYDVTLYFQTEDGDRASHQLVESGTPSDDAVRIVETVTLFDETPLSDTNGHARETTLADVEGDFYAPNVDATSPIYNVIRVEVVLWRA